MALKEKRACLSAGETVHGIQKLLTAACNWHHVLVKELQPFHKNITMVTMTFLIVQ